VVDLSIIIVSWNVRDLLRQCLSSVFAVRSSAVEDAPSAASLEPRTEVIVVDNASTDGSPDMVCAEFPDVRLVVNQENRGFTAANNQGLDLSQGRTLLLLNPDTEVVGDALATMVRYMDAHPEVGALGPQLRYPDGSPQSSRRRFPTFATALVESTVIQEWWADNRVLRRYYMADTPNDAIQPVDWLVGACLLVRRPLYEQVGGLDEGFFMYSEEMDWCRRFKAAGWQVVYLPTATIIHHEGKSSEQVVPARHIHFQTSKIRYFRKHHGALQAEVLRWFLLVTYVYQLAREGFKWLVGHKRPLRAERLKAYRQVLGSRLVQSPRTSGSRLDQSEKDAR
jgi:N-acetylglucosaminyl-diphospho-decaprenol L-rhamnosyltransferase